MALLVAASRLLMALVIGGVAWLALEQWRAADRAAEKRGLLVRAVELNARSLVPGSPLACLAAGAADGLDNACENVVFGTPESAAAAVAYTDAQLALLADASDLAARGEPNLTDNFAGLRRTLEIDRYGLVAHLLSTRDGCTVESCRYFVRLRETEVIKANIKGRTFESYIARHADDWTLKPAVAAPAATPTAPPEEPPPPPQASAPRTVQPSAKYDFPSAASIPPVNCAT